jgi:ATP-dependent RNA helicase DeaD
VFESLRETLAKGDYSRHDPLIDPLLDAGHTATDIASALLHLLIAETKRESQKIAEDEPRHETGKRHSPERRSFERDDRRSDERRYEERRSDARKRPAPRHEPPDKHARRQKLAPPTPMARLDLDIGKNHGVRPGDILGFVAGAGGLTRADVGAIKIMPDHTLVEINPAFAALTARRLDGMRFKSDTVRARLVGED